MARTKEFDDEWDIIDLEPYKTGKAIMRIRCHHKGCKNNIDITKDYIVMEEQNNIRKQCKGYDPACDKLYIFGRKCEEHKEL